MNGDEPDYASLTRHLRQCLEKSKSCPTLYRLSVDAYAISLWKFVYYEIQKKLYGDSDLNLAYENRQLLINTIELPEITKRSVPEHLLSDLEYSLWDKSVQIFKAEICCELSFGEYKNIEFCWTAHGRLNIPATIQSSQLKDDDDKFYKAYYYCLEEDVKRLWEENNEDLKNLCDTDIDTLKFKYWESFVAGKAISPEEIQTLVQDGIEMENNIIVEYLWRKLEPRRRRELLGNWIDEVQENHLTYPAGLKTGYFLLTVATDAQLLSLLKWKPSVVLTLLALSYYPEIKLYASPVMEQISPLVNDDERKFIVKELFQAISISLSVMFYEQDVMILWNGGSNEWRSMMMMTSKFCPLGLLSNKVVTLLIRMFKNATQEEKFEFLKNKASVIINYFNELQLALKKFIAEFLGSENSVRTFKQELATCAIKDHMNVLLSKEIYVEFFDYCCSTDLEIAECK